MRSTRRTRNPPKSPTFQGACPGQRKQISNFRQVNVMCTTRCAADDCAVRVPPHRVHAWCAHKITRTTRIDLISKHTRLSLKTKTTSLWWCAAIQPSPPQKPLAPWAALLGVLAGCLCVCVCLRTRALERATRHTHTHNTAPTISRLADV